MVILLYDGDAPSIMEMLFPSSICHNLIKNMLYLLPVWFFRLVTRNVARKLKHGNGVQTGIGQFL